VAETIEYEQFEHTEHSAVDTAHADLSRLSDIPMELSVEIGRAHMTVGETLDLRVGSVVALERLAGETADLLVNGSAIARGEVVVIDEQYGLRITEILDGQADAEQGADADAVAAVASSPAAEPAAAVAAPAGAAPGAGASADAPDAPADAGRDAAGTGED